MTPLHQFWKFAHGEFACSILATERSKIQKTWMPAQPSVFIQVQGTPRIRCPTVATAKQEFLRWSKIHRKISLITKVVT